MSGERTEDGVSPVEDLLDQVRGEQDRAVLSEEALAALRDGMERQIESAKRSPAYWWRTRPTLIRRGIALGSLVVLMVCVMTWSGRADFSRYPGWRLGLESGALLTLLAASLWLGLRPLHQPSLPRAVSWFLTALTLGATFVLAVLPPAHEGSHLPPGMAVVEHAMPCLLFGLLFGLPMYVLVRLLDHGTPTAAIIAAAAAGLAGNLALQMHCPVNDPAHNLWAHFSVGLIFVVVIVGLEWFRYRIK